MKLLLLITALVVTQDVSAQAAHVGASIALAEPAVSCALHLQTDGDFGSVRRSSSDIVLDPTGIRGAPGTFSFTGTHASAFAVQITFPPALAGKGALLPWRGAWAQSLTPHTGFAPIAGATYQRENLNATSFAYYFRIGGTVSGPTHHATPGVYRAKIAVAASCH